MNFEFTITDHDTEDQAGQEYTLNEGKLIKRGKKKSKPKENPNFEAESGGGSSGSNRGEKRRGGGGRDQLYKRAGKA